MGIKDPVNSARLTDAEYKRKERLSFNVPKPPKIRRQKKSLPGQIDLFDEAEDQHYTKGA